MKKTVITLIIICILNLCACSKISDSIMVAGISDGNKFVSSIKVDIDLSNEFKVANCSKNYKYEIDNEIVVGSYVRSLLSQYYNGDIDEYEVTSIDGREIQFRVNRRTKKVVAYSIVYRNGYNTTLNKSYEECLQIAKNKLLEFDDGEYVQESIEENQKALNIPECGSVFSYYFRKLLSGKSTTVLVQIDVNTDGVVVHVNAGNVNEFCEKDIKVLENYESNEEILLEEIKNKLISKSASDDITNAYFEIQKSEFCKLKDGNIYIKCEVMIKDIATEYSEYAWVLKKI